MTDMIKALTICAGGAAIGLAVSGGNPAGAVGGCLVASLVTSNGGCNGPNADENPVPTTPDGGEQYDGGEKYQDIYIPPDSSPSEDLFATTVMAGELEKVRPLAESLTADASSEEEAVVAVTQWVENNFFHYTDFGNGDSYSPAIYENNEVMGGFFSISIEDIFRERAVGCHFASGIIITMLRSIGIAADYVRSEGHGVTYLPSLDLYIHGDHVACLVCLPAEELLQGRKDLDYWAVHPGFPSDIDGRMVSRGYLAFQKTLEEEYGLGLELQRRSDSLHVSGYTWDVGFESAANICSEYNLQRDGIIVYSDLLPIQDLDKLNAAL